MKCKELQLMKTTVLAESSLYFHLKNKKNHAQQFNKIRKKVVRRYTCKGNDSKHSHHRKSPEDIKNCFCTNFIGWKYNKVAKWIEKSSKGQILPQNSGVIKIKNQYHKNQHSNIRSYSNTFTSMYRPYIFSYSLLNH